MARISNQTAYMRGYNDFEKVESYDDHPYSATDGSGHWIAKWRQGFTDRSMGRSPSKQYVSGDVPPPQTQGGAG